MIPERKIDVAQLLHKLTDEKKRFPQAEVYQTSRFDIVPSNEFVSEAVSGVFTYAKYSADLPEDLAEQGSRSITINVSDGFDLELIPQQPIGLLLDRIEKLKIEAPEKVDNYIEKVADDKEDADRYASEELVSKFVTVVPRITIGKERLLVEEKWEGVVEETDGDSFMCTIRGQLSDKTERSVFDVDEVPEADRELIRKGAVFYWYIGLRLDGNGRQQRVSEIRFRRLPEWRFVSEEKVKEQKSHYAKLLSACAGGDNQ